jgi:hypothetical protein
VLGLGKDFAHAAASPGAAAGSAGGLAGNVFKLALAA